MSNETTAAGDAGKFLSLHSASFPTMLAVLTGLRAASAPLLYVVLLGAVGAIAILAGEFNSAVVVGSMVRLSSTA